MLIWCSVVIGAHQWIMVCIIIKIVLLSYCRYKFLYENKHFFLQSSEKCYCVEFWCQATVEVTEQKRSIGDGLRAEEVGKQDRCPFIHLYFTGVQCWTIHLPPEWLCPQELHCCFLLTGRTRHINARHMHYWWRAGADKLIEAAGVFFYIEGQLKATQFMAS